MKHYIIYDNNGDILRKGTCQDSDFDIQAKNEENIIEGECFDDVNYKVINGELVYSPKQKSDDELLKDIRKQRNAILSQTDWTQMPDSPLTDTQKAQYKAYRQALRDLPLKYATMNNINEVIFPHLEDFNEE